MKKVAIAVVVYQGKVLCIQRAGADRAGEWESPAGHLDEGEKPHQAAVREVEEETGLRVVLWDKGFRIKLRDTDGIGYVFLASPVGEDKDVRLNPDEHRQYRWVSVKDLDRVKPSPPNYAETVRRVLRMNRKSRTSSFAFRDIRGVGALPEDLNDALLLGDEVEIFLSAHEDGYNKDGPFRGIVDRRNRNFFWLRKFSNDDSVQEDDPVIGRFDWRNRGKWDVIRIKRNNQGESKTFTYEKMGTGEGEGRTNGIALLIEPETSTPNNAMFNAFPHSSPTLDKLSYGQVPSAMKAVVDSPAYDIPLRSVRSILESQDLLDDYTLTQGERGRVMVLTTDNGTKAQIRKVLEKNGKKVKDLGSRYKMASLIVANGKELGALELASLAMAVAAKAPDTKVRDFVTARAYEFLRTKTGVTEGQARLMLGMYKPFIQNGNLKLFLQKLYEKKFDVPSLEGISYKNILKYINNYHANKDSTKAQPDNKTASQIGSKTWQDMFGSTRTALMPPPAAPGMPPSSAPGGPGQPKITVDLPTPAGVNVQKQNGGVELSTNDPSKLTQTMQTYGQLNPNGGKPGSTTVSPYGSKQARRRV